MNRQMKQRVPERIPENGKTEEPVRMIALAINADGSAAIQHPGVSTWEVATILRKAANEWEKKLGARD